MSRDDRKNLVLIYIGKVWNNVEPSAFDELTAETYAYHLGGQPARGKEAMRKFLKEVHTAFPDWRVEIKGIIAEGNTVAVRWIGNVTHQGVFQGIPPTGKKVSVSGINMCTIKDGRISQEFEQMDSLGMLKQLGVLPSSKASNT